jgi:2-polyprenyl-3-methyl-5-hydroxy-6-metoxy-1,4-benzoquinol methylase
MSQKLSGIHKIFSYPLIYSLTQIIMSGETVRSALVKKIINPNAKVLDIGCGTAKIIDSLPSVDYYGYDISKKYINYARKKYKSKRNNFFCKKFTINEINNIPRVDFILLFGVIHHLEDEELDQIFPALKKVLKKKGIIITCDPVYIKKQNTIAHFLIKNDVGQNVRSKENYLKFLRKYFKKIKFKIKHQNFIPYTWFSAQCIK